MPASWRAGALRGFAGTVAAITALVGRHHEAGVPLLMTRAFKTDMETRAPPETLPI